MGEAYVNTSKNWINTNYEIADGAGVKNDLDPNLKDFDITVKPEEEDNNNETPKQEPIECANNFVLINGVCKDPTKETLIVTLQPYPTDTYYLPGKFGTKAYHDMDVKITLSAPCQENVWFVYNMWNQADSRYNEWIDGGCYVKPGETSCMKRPLQPNKNLRKIFPDSPWCMYFSRGSTFKPFKNVKIVVDKTYLSVDQMGHESSLTNTYNIQGSNGIIEYSYTDEGYQKLLNYSDEYTYNAQKQYSQTLD